MGRLYLQDSPLERRFRNPTDRFVKNMEKFRLNRILQMGNTVSYPAASSATNSGHRIGSNTMLALPKKVRTSPPRPQGDTLYRVATLAAALMVLATVASIL